MKIVLTLIAIVAATGCASYPDHVPEDTMPWRVRPESALVVIRSNGYFDLSALPDGVEIVKAVYRARRWGREPWGESSVTVQGKALYLTKGLKITKVNMGGSGAVNQITYLLSIAKPSVVGGGETELFIEEGEVTWDKQAIAEGILGPHLYLGARFDALFIEAHRQEIPELPEPTDYLIRKEGPSTTYLKLLEQWNAPLTFALQPGIWDTFEMTDAVRQAYNEDRRLLFHLGTIKKNFRWWASKDMRRSPLAPQLVIEFTTNRPITPDLTKRDPNLEYVVVPNEADITAARAVAKPAASAPRLEVPDRGATPPSDDVHFCSSCGRKLQDGTAKFCGDCGARVRR